jgi:hypothetical protein
MMMMLRKVNAPMMQRNNIKPKLSINVPSELPPPELVPAGIHIPKPLSCARVSAWI